MRPISIKKHEWCFATMVQISSIKHSMTILEFWICYNSGGPKTIVLSQGFPKKKRFLLWWSLDNFGSMEINKKKKSGNLETQANPTKSNIFLKNYGIIVNIFKFSWAQNNRFLLVFPQKRNFMMSCLLLFLPFIVGPLWYLTLPSPRGKEAEKLQNLKRWECENV